MNITKFTSLQNIFHKNSGKLRIYTLALIFLFSFSSISANDGTASKFEAIEKDWPHLKRMNNLRSELANWKKAEPRRSPSNYPGLSPRMKPRRAFFDRFRREFKSSQIKALAPGPVPNHGPKSAKECQNIPSGNPRSPHPHETIR